MIHEHSLLGLLKNNQHALSGRHAAFETHTDSQQQPILMPHPLCITHQSSPVRTHNLPYRYCCFHIRLQITFQGQPGAHAHPFGGVTWHDVMRTDIAAVICMGQNPTSQIDESLLLRRIQAQCGLDRHVLIMVPELEEPQSHLLPHRLRWRQRRPQRSGQARIRPSTRRLWRS